VLLTTETKYIAATHAAKEAIWLRRLIGELTSPLDLLTPLFCNNNGSISLAKDPIFHPRTKHIDIRYHFIHEKVQNRKITIIQVSSDKNVANIFTKALPQPRLETLLSELEVRDMD
jgi:hypothetical protein